MAMASHSGLLGFTPTWVVAAVCFAIVGISLAAARFLHYLGKWLKYNGQEALYSALLKVKEELMLLGFISFLLSGFQGFISHICIPERAASVMLACKEGSSKAAEHSNLCNRKDEVPLLSLEALHQLHIFVFVLAVVHVVFCAATMVLGGAKMKKWHSWEQEIQREIREQGATSHQTEQEGKATTLYAQLHRDHRNSVQEHSERFWRRLAVISWTMSFCKQFFDSVSKSDYRVLRAAFILRHCPGYPEFDFHKYMINALEIDFRKVVGISWYLWLFVILFLLLNIQGWYTYFWLSFLPLLLLLIVGAKLEHIIARLAQEAVETCTGGRMEGSLIKPSKDHFWFGKPKIVLYLIHFILFQNSFELGFFFWVLASYGFKSCIMEKKVYPLSTLVIGIAVQVLCSYSTLPLYAIVTHMSGDIKLEAALSDRVHVPLLGWARNTRKGKRLVPTLPGPFSRKGKELATEVEVTRAPTDCIGSSRSMLAPPDLIEIVTSTTEDARPL